MMRNWSTYFFCVLFQNKPFTQSITMVTELKIFGIIILFIIKHDSCSLVQSCLQYQVHVIQRTWLMGSCLQQAIWARLSWSQRKHRPRASVRCKHKKQLASSRWTQTSRGVRKQRRNKAFLCLSVNIMCANSSKHFQTTNVDLESCMKLFLLTHMYKNKIK